MTDNEMLAEIRRALAVNVECVFIGEKFNEYKIDETVWKKGRFVFYKGIYNSGGIFVRFFSDTEQKKYLEKRCRRINQILHRVKY